MSAETTRRRLPLRTARNWPRILLIAVVAPVIAVPVLVAGPLLAAAVLGIAVLSDWVLGRKRRRAFRAAARESRRRQLEQAIAAGGVSDEPAEGRGKAGATDARREFGAPKHMRNYYGWPRGHL